MVAPVGIKLVLASGSPRRRELLASAGIAFEVRLAPVAELRRATEAPADYVQRLARDKAFAVEANDHEIVLGADTTVVADDLVLEKPIDADDAQRMLALLSGRKHRVLTGICLRQGARTVVGLETTLVEFTELSVEEIAAYVATGEPLDKAGAYAIQGIASRWITRIEGCYFNVVGLPVARVWQELQKFHSNGAE
jgi:septum formation protein